MPDALTFEDQVAISKRMQRIARLIDAELIKATGGKRVPWSLYTWGGHRSQYVSNVEREQAKFAMRETLARMQPCSVVSLHVGRPRMTAPAWIATPGGAAYCATPAKPAKPGTLTCTVCAHVDQPKGKPCKLCGRTEAPERRD